MDTPGPDSQAESSAAPPAGTPDPTSPAEVETISLDEARKLRKEAESLRKRLKAAEEAQLTEQQRKDSELETLRAEKAAWEAERQQTRVSRAVEAAATQAGAIYPDAILPLLPPDALTLDSAGQPTNLKHVLADLRATRPALFRPQSGDGGAGRDSAAAPADMNSMIRRLAGRG